MVISMISKLATLALALSHGVMAGSDPFYPNMVKNSSVAFFPDMNCASSAIAYWSPLSPPHGCDTSCQDLDNYLSIAVVDPWDETTCYLWEVPGFSGNYSAIARGTFPEPQCSLSISNITLQVGVIRSAWCYRGICPGYSASSANVHFPSTQLGGNKQM